MHSASENFMEIFMSHKIPTKFSRKNNSDLFAEKTLPHALSKPFSLEEHECYEMTQAADKLFMSVRTLRNKVSKGDDLPPSFRFSRKRLFPAREFEAWLEEKRNTSHVKNTSSTGGDRL